MQLRHIVYSASTLEVSAWLCSTPKLCRSVRNHATSKHHSHATTHRHHNHRHHRRLVCVGEAVQRVAFKHARRAARSHIDRSCPSGAGAQPVAHPSRVATMNRWMVTGVAVCVGVCIGGVLAIARGVVDPRCACASQTLCLQLAQFDHASPLHGACSQGQDVARGERPQATPSGSGAWEPWHESPV